MLRLKGMMGVWRGMTLWLTMACLLGCTGCSWLWPKDRTYAGEVVPDASKRRRVVTRAELLHILTQDMGRLATLTAKAVVTVTDQNVLVPATWADNRRRRQGKPYSKKFRESHVNGQLILSRTMEESRNIRFMGEVTGVNRSFLLLGKDDKFWIVMPSVGEEGGGARGYVYKGTVEREVKRPRDFISVRPQDMLDLLLVDEAFSALRGEWICYMTTWEGFYILNFLREGRPEHIYSTIWIERERLTVAIHQLFDGSGEVVAEARFGDYKKYSAKGSNVEAHVPTKVIFLWPRDKLVMDVELSFIGVNKPIAPDKFKPIEPSDYEVRDLDRLIKTKPPRPD